jgi:hypothetical protein
MLWTIAVILPESENMQKRPKDLYGVPEPKPNNPDEACMMS